ncbi:MAG TPA: hypothetical protein VLZ83_14255 [Edaphocola sp.]|nr:hypothetical protein [Edaphocola sp.]
MKKFFILLFALVLIGAFPFQNCFAQSEKYEYTPKLFQSSLRIGLVNASLNGAYRLNPNTILSLDLGLGLTALLSNYYNKYNYNYTEYDKKTPEWLNLGHYWWSAYSSLQVKYILSSNSKIKYTKSPYANTYYYTGLQLKGNTPSVDYQTDPYNRFRETYQATILVGRQLEFGENASAVFDIYVAMGLFVNYKVEYFEPIARLGVRIGINVFEKL